MNILKYHADTDLGKKLKLSEIRCRNDFVKKIPLTEYNFYKASFKLYQDVPGQSMCRYIINFRISNHVTQTVNRFRK